MKEKEKLLLTQVEPETPVSYLASTAGLRLLQFFFCRDIPLTHILYIQGRIRRGGLTPDLAPHMTGITEDAV